MSKETELKYYNDNRSKYDPRTKLFLESLNSEYRYITLKDISSNFIKSIGITKIIIEELLNNGDIEVDKSKVINGRRISPNGYRRCIKETSQDGHRVSFKEVKVRYKGFGNEETLRLTKDDNKVVKDLAESMTILDEEEFVNNLIHQGFSKTKAWFYYMKIKDRK